MSLDVLDAQMMARAILLARRGLYSTDPNPRVGCVLVQDGEIVGEGFHRRAGEPHAERNAIDAAGPRARGATTYVTLEPCCHYGRTPPCTDALLTAKVARVVVGMEDPNPLVRGRGLARLRAAGVEVRTGVLERDARALNPGFERRMRGGLPYVRCKLAASLDGRTAMASGESKWVTASDARHDVHRLRARSSAVVTGIGTVLVDDPSMNVRLGPKELPSLSLDELPRQPLRVVVDTRLRMPLDARMLQLPGATLIATCEHSPKPIARANAVGAEVCVLPPDPAGRVDLYLLLRYLAEREINEVLIEAGPTLAGAAMASGLVDELVLYLAPHLMGDAARGLFHLPGIERMEQRIGLVLDEVRRVGVDLRLRLRRPEPWEPKAEEQR